MALGNDSIGCMVAKRAEPRTVEEVLNQRLESARKEVENLCLAKAKAETLGLLKYPYAELCNILHVF